MWERFRQPAVQQALPPGIFQEWRQRYRARSSGGKFPKKNDLFIFYFRPFQLRTTGGKEEKSIPYKRNSWEKTRRNPAAIHLENFWNPKTWRLSPWMGISILQIWVYSAASPSLSAPVDTTPVQTVILLTCEILLGIRDNQKLSRIHGRTRVESWLFIIYFQM